MDFWSPECGVVQTPCDLYKGFGLPVFEPYIQYISISRTPVPGKAQLDSLNLERQTVREWTPFTYLVGSGLDSLYVPAGKWAGHPVRSLWEVVRTPCTHLVGSGQDSLYVPRGKWTRLPVRTWRKVDRTPCTRTWWEEEPTPYTRTWWKVDSTPCTNLEKSGPDSLYVPSRKWSGLPVRTWWEVAWTLDSLYVPGGKWAGLPVRTWWKAGWTPCTYLVGSGPGSLYVPSGKWAGLPIFQLAPAGLYAGDHQRRTRNMPYRFWQPWRKELNS